MKPPVRRTGNRQSGQKETDICAAEPPSWKSESPGWGRQLIGYIYSLSAESYLWLVKTGTFDEALQAVALAVVVFDVDQRSKTALERDVLHLHVIHLCDKAI